MKAWMVGPKDDWVVIVHAETAGQAKMKGVTVNADDYIEMIAHRLPQFDNKKPDVETLEDLGWFINYEKPSDISDYTFACGCELCRLGDT